MSQTCHRRTWPVLDISLGWWLGALKDQVAIILAGDVPSRVAVESFAPWAGPGRQPHARATGLDEDIAQWDGRHSGTGVKTQLASNHSLAESPTMYGASASTGTSRSVVSVPGATLISRGRPSSSYISTVKV